MKHKDKDIKLTYWGKRSNPVTKIGYASRSSIINTGNGKIEFIYYYKELKVKGRKIYRIHKIALKYPNQSSDACLYDEIYVSGINVKDINMVELLCYDIATIVAPYVGTVYGTSTPIKEESIKLSKGENAILKFLTDYTSNPNLSVYNASWIIKHHGLP